MWEDQLLPLVMPVSSDKTFFSLAQSPKIFLKETATLFEFIKPSLVFISLIS